MGLRALSMTHSQAGRAVPKGGVTRRSPEGDECRAQDDPKEQVAHQTGESHRPHHRHLQGGEGGHAEEHRHQDQSTENPPDYSVPGAPADAAADSADPGAENPAEQPADHGAVEEMVEPAYGQTGRADDLGYNGHHRHAAAV